MSKSEVFCIGDYEYRKDIMERIQRCFLTAVNDHCKVLAVRLDVRYPQGFMHDGTNTQFSKLMHQISGHYDEKKTDCRYVWAREQNRSNTPHYHLLLLLDGSQIEKGWGVWSIATEFWRELLSANSDAYIHLCLPFQNRDGIMIRRPSSRSEGEKLRLQTAEFERAYRAALDWAIYLAKTYTKGETPHGVREWGSSRF